MAIIMALNWFLFLLITVSFFGPAIYPNSTSCFVFKIDKDEYSQVFWSIFLKKVENCWFSQSNFQILNTFQIRDPLATNKILPIRPAFRMLQVLLWIAQGNLASTSTCVKFSAIKKPKQLPQMRWLRAGIIHCCPFLHRSQNPSEQRFYLVEISKHYSAVYFQTFNLAKKPITDNARPFRQGQRALAQVRRLTCIEKNYGYAVTRLFVSWLLFWSFSVSVNDD